jgi:hypothetical protein
LLQTISSDEIAEWAAYYQLDPFGSYRGDLQTANVAMWIAQVNAKKGHTFKLADFMLKFGEPEPTKTMTPKEIHDRLSMMFGRKAHG